MKILVLKTDIKTKKMVKQVRPAFHNHPEILDWSVDIKDIDNVLRIEALDGMDEEKAIQMVKQAGHYCEALQD